MAIAGPEAVEHPHFVWWGPVPKNLVDGRGWVIEPRAWARRGDP